MRTIPDYSEWETLTLYFYRFLVRNSTNSYLSYYQIYNIYYNSKKTHNKVKYVK